MGQIKCVKEFQQLLVQCEDALKWSKTSEFVKHYEKIHIVGGLCIVAMCMWVVSSLSGFEQLDTEIKGVLLFGACAVSLIPAWLTINLMSRVGMSVLKCKQYAIWQDFLKPNQAVEIKKARHEFMGLLKDNNICSTSEAIQRLKKLEEQTPLSTYFWNTCYNIFQNDPGVQEITMEKEMCHFVEVVDVVPENVTRETSVKIFKL